MPTYRELKVKEAGGVSSVGDPRVQPHIDDTTGVHGISNTANLVYTSDSRLSDTRTPTDGSVSTAKIADGAVTSAKIADGTIVNGDISDTAAIAQSKVSNLTTDLSAKAPLASPTFTGTPSAPTATAGTNTTQIATTAFVRGEVSSLVNAAPAALDTLGELATALGNDANFSTTVTNALAAKAPLASPTFTGTPAASTAAADTNSTQVATTAFVVGQAGSATPIVDGTAAAGTSLRYARQDHVHPTDTSRAPLASPTFTGTVTVPTLLLTTADTATAASHYAVETGTDGVIRPKTLANVRTEIVTTAAVNAAAATTVGTITSGVWNGTSISTTYTDAKVTSVNGSTGAVTGLATTAGKLSQFGATTSSELAGVISDETGSGALVFATSPALTRPVLTSPLEVTTVSATAAATTVTFDAITQGVLYYTTNSSANWTLNIRGNSGTTLSSMLSVGSAITVAFMVTNGSTAYYQTGFQIDGVSQTARWQGGTAPSSGNASSIDVYTFTIIKTAATPTYTVLGQQTKFA